VNWYNRKPRVHLGFPLSDGVRCRQVNARYLTLDIERVSCRKCLVYDQEDKARPAYEAWKKRFKEIYPE
jgi:hypothetical protein